MAWMNTRCFGDGPGHELYATYHDTEWGVPSHDDTHLFEMLVLEGMQAGLNFELVLKKREAFRKAFHNFDVKRVSRMSDEELEVLTEEPAIIRNRGKIWSARTNARAFVEIQKEFGTFDRFLWRFVAGKPIVNRLPQPLCVSPEGSHLAKELKKRGMTFVGPKIAYSYMQAVGLVDDHLLGCWRAT